MEAPDPAAFVEYRVLSDSPNVDGPDALGADAMATQLEQLIVASKDAAPFTVGIEGGWGVGKSTVMKRLQMRLAHESKAGGRIDARTVWFNAWTALDADVLEGLVRSVLNEIDSNVLRRVARKKKLIRSVGVVGSIVGGLFGLGNIVDRVWSISAADPKRRNELNELVRDAMKDWTKKTPKFDGRLIVVFIDDLDRCSAKTVMRVFEAMKLYLDAPGFVFVLGWDTSQVLTAVATEKGGEDRLPERYVEKIIQFGFRIPRPTDEQLTLLTELYCGQAGLTTILSLADRELLLEVANGNPRQLKRLMNRFILLRESTDPDTDSTVLIHLLMLQSSYTWFYERLANSPATEVAPAGGETLPSLNELTEFADYVDGRAAANGLNTSALVEILRRRGFDVDPDRPLDYFEAWERSLPDRYTSLAVDSQFRKLVLNMSEPERGAVRDLARSAALAVPEPIDPHLTSSASPASEVSALGKSVLWIDDKPNKQDHALLPSDVDLQVATSTSDAQRLMRNRTTPPDLIISDIGRGADPQAGLDGIRELQEAGYTGPVIFYTMRANPRQAVEAKELNAAVITDPNDLRQHVTRMLNAQILGK